MFRAACSNPVGARAGPRARKPKVPNNSPKRLSNTSPWLSSSGTIAHPCAPLGGCGPGYSKIPSPLGSTGNDSNPISHPQSPVGSQITLSKEDARKISGTPLANAPPRTRKQTFDVKREQTQRTDILVKGKVLADGRDPNLGMSAQTRLDPKKLKLEFPKPFVEGGMVTREVGKFSLKGTVTIQVVYDTNGSPKEPAGWGRGTMKKDIKNGDTTAGFHESCHLADYVNWLKTESLPVFKPKLPMSEKDYRKACEKFDKDLEDYFARAESSSEKNTDEVGKKKSEVLRGRG